MLIGVMGRDKLLFGYFELDLGSIGLGCTCSTTLVLPLHTRKRACGQFENYCWKFGGPYVQELLDISPL